MEFAMICLLAAGLSGGFINGLLVLARVCLHLDGCYRSCRHSRQSLSSCWFRY